MEFLYHFVVALLLVGTKNDLVKESGDLILFVFSFRNYLHISLPFIETSSKLDTNIEEALDIVVMGMMEGTEMITLGSGVKRARYSSPKQKMNKIKHLF